MERGGKREQTKEGLGPNRVRAPANDADDQQVRTSESTCCRPLQTANQVAVQLTITIDTLARWRRLGKGPKFLKFGRGRSAVVRYRPEDVDAFVKASLLTSTSDTGNSE